MKHSLLVILAFSTLAVAAELSGPERMIGIAKVAKLSGIDITHEETESLKAIQPLLLKISHSPDAVRLFWPQVQGYAAKQISWTEAQELILKGSVRSVMQTHSLIVTFQTDNGAMYSTREDRIDEVHTLIKSVDPKGIFIRYATE